MKFELPSPILLDGGLASQLEAQGCNLDHPLWSAFLLKENPKAIYEAHLAYLRAGAQIITTASYQASFPGFAKIGIGRKETAKLLVKSVELAIEARETFYKESALEKPVWVAASIGPYGAYLADGSEYKGNYQVERNQLYSFHRERLEVLKETEADFFACETIPSSDEALLLAEIIEELKVKAWISFSCKDVMHTNEGQKIADCIRALENFEEVFAVGINCSSPQYISSLLKEIKSTNTSKKIILYPNSGEIYHPDDKSWSGDADLLTFRRSAHQWLAAGADIIGGCCRVLDAHIQEIAKVL